MNAKSLLRITGIAGFIISIVTTYIYITYILVPTITPILIHQIESQLSSEGVSVNQGEISGVVSFITMVMPITTITGLVISWLIEAAVLMALLRAFRIKSGFIDTWLLSGNYFYLNVVQTAIIIATPILNYVISATAVHKIAISEPPLLAIGLVFTVIGSLFLAYIFAKVYGTSMTRALIPTLIALIIFWAVSVAI